MKFSHWMFVFFLMAPVVASAQNELPGKGPAEAPLKTLRDKASYGIGLNIAASLKSQGAEVDPRLLVRGLLDALEGRKPLLTNAELRTVMTNYGAEMEAKQIAAAKAAGGKNRQAGIAFLEANKKKPGVIVLPSGLQYKILKRGTGRTPKASDTVTTHYHGTQRSSTAPCSIARTNASNRRAFPSMASFAVGRKRCN